MNPGNEFNKIESYLFGQMNDKEGDDFINDLSKAPKLKEQMALHQLEHEAIELAIQSDLRSSLQQWKLEKETIRPLEQISEKQAGRIIRFRQYITAISVAASICLLLVFGFNVRSYNNSQLSNSFFENTANRSVRGSESSVVPEILLPGWSALQQKEYSLAITLLEEIKDVNYIDQAKLMIGEAQYALGAYPKAINTFRDVVDQSNFANFKEQAEWQLALTYLTEKKTANLGIQMVNVIVNNANHSHYPDAQELLKKKNSFWGRFSGQ